MGPGDVTTEACVPAEMTAKGFFLSREPLVVAGVELLDQIYGGEGVTLLSQSGDAIAGEEILARVSGSARQLLTLERTALNFCSG